MSCHISLHTFLSKTVGLRLLWLVKLYFLSIERSSSRFHSREVTWCGKIAYNEQSAPGSSSTRMVLDIIHPRTGCILLYLWSVIRSQLKVVWLQAIKINSRTWKIFLASSRVAACLQGIFSELREGFLFGYCYLQTTGQNKQPRAHCVRSLNEQAVQDGHTVAELAKCSNIKKIQLKILQKIPTPLYYKCIILKYYCSISVNHSVLS